MAPVVLDITMSLDGFVAGPEDSPVLDELIGTPGAMVVGRRIFDVQQCRAVQEHG